MMDGNIILSVAKAMEVLQILSQAESPLSLKELVSDGGLVADIKGIWRHRGLPENLRYWSL